MNKSNIHSPDNKVIYYDQLVKSSSKARAFGLWEFSKDLNLTGLYRIGILEFLKENGFYRRKTANNSYDIVQVRNNILKFVLNSDVVNYLRDYIEKENGSIQIYQSKNEQGNSRLIQTPEFFNLFLKQYHLFINDNFKMLLEVNADTVLRDTKDIAYLLFKNTVITITKDSIIKKSYEDFKNTLIYESEIIEKEFELQEDWKETPFVKFIRNITNDDPKRKNTIRSAIGYLLHGFNDPAKAQAVILYDEELTDIDTPKGGTGKGIIGQATSKMKLGFIQMDGKKIRFDSPFTFQRVREDTKIIFIDDVGRNFDIDGLNSILTEGLITEAKFKTALHIPKSDMPKFLIASNIILPFEGTTRIRRQYIIELSNHYSKKINEGTGQPIVDEHGKRFFDEWSDNEWNGFFTFMMKSIQYYLINGLLEPPVLNMKKNRLIQQIGNLIFSFFEKQSIQRGSSYNTKELCEQFKQEYSIDEYTQRQFSIHLQKYILYMGMNVDFKKGQTIVS